MAPLFSGLLLTAKGISLLLATLAAYLGWNVLRVRSKQKQVLMRWEPSSFGLIRVAGYGIMLFLLVGGLLSYAFYVRDMGRHPSAHLWLELWLLSTGLVALTGLNHFLLKLLFMQAIGEEGVYRLYFSRHHLHWETHLEPWSAFHDYYVQEDEIISKICLLKRDGGMLCLEVPTYLLRRLIRLVNHEIDKYAFLLRYGRRVSSSGK